MSPLAGDLDWSRCDPGLKATFDRLVAGGAIISDKDRAAPTLAGWRADPRSENFVYGRC